MWFDLEGKRLSEGQLRELVGKGKTKKTRWPGADGGTTGRLVLDVGRPLSAGRDEEEDRGAHPVRPFGASQARRSSAIRWLAPPDRKWASRNALIAALKKSS